MVAGQLKRHFCWPILIGISLMILRSPIFVLIFDDGFYAIKMVDSFLSVQIGYLLI
jgi:hypothetical protein